jgi:hypothetical protein
MLVTGHTIRQTHSAAADPFAKFDGQGERWKIRFDFFAREEWEIRRIFGGKRDNKLD